MKKFRLLSLVLALITVFTMLAGCSKDEGEEKTDGEATTAAADIKEEEKISYDDMPSELKAEKIGSISPDSIIPANNSGVTYKAENGKYGIISVDGKNDTGAKYTICKAVGEYFFVAVADTKSASDVASLNCFGLVDAKGKELVPMKYATATKISDRYIKICEVTEQADNEDDTLVYLSNDIASFGPDEDDARFKGKWYIYDTVAGKMLDGATGTNSYRIYAYGNLVEYVTDAEEQITVNEKGVKIPEEARVFGNGCYALVKDNAGAVYNSDGKKLFDYAMDGFIPQGSEGEYFLARKTDGSVMKYALMDNTGKVVSAEFDDISKVYGELIYSEEKIYDFKGNAVFAGSVESVSFDEQLGNVWFLESDDEYTMIKKDGTILYQGKSDDTVSVETSRFLARDNSSGTSKYYSLADKDYTIEGNAIGPWLVKVSGANNTKDIVDTISGKTIISGYTDYNCVAVPGSAIYVFAAKAGGGMDVYAVK